MQKSLKRSAIMILVLVTTPVLLISATQQQEPSGAKSLFYDPSSGATLKPSEKLKSTQHGKIRVKPVLNNQVKYVGIHYWIELEGHGTVTDSHIFHTGDRLKLRVRSNVDGYLSLWALDPSGRGHLLFPSLDQPDAENFVKADDDYTHLGFIKFTLPVQDERLLVFFSRSKSDLPSLNQKILDAKVVSQALGPSGAKSLVFETDQKNSDETGTYVVNKAGGPIVKEIRLKHQPAPK